MDQGSDLTQIQFRGEDATECRGFIAAILKHASSQGKQRDDQWMADLAATCLVNDALTWWSALDEEVQGSWKLLRRAMLAKYRPMFYGGSGEEVEKFIRAVSDKAIDEGKETDDKWIVKYASSCMAGEALRWYAYLDSDKQDTWKQLQQALLAQYPRDGPGGPPPNLVPTPSAAAPAAPAPKGMRRGRIRVSKSGSSPHYYLSRLLSANSRISPTSSIGDALEVEWNPDTDSLQKLFIPDSQLTGYDMLGIKWLSSNLAVATNWSGICAVNSQTNATAMSGFSGSLLADAWKLSSPGSGGGGASTVLAMAGKEVLYPRLRFDPDGYVWFCAKEKDPSFIAEMFLEPILEEAFKPVDVGRGRRRLPFFKLMTSGG